MAAPETPSDADLLTAAAAGDFAAFETLVRRYHDRVFRLASGMLKDRTDAEEVTQETFLNLFKSLGSFRGDSRPSSWIFRIAANAALMRLRSKRRKPLLSIEDQPPAVAEARAVAWPDGGPEATALSAELREHLEGAMERLPGTYRAVVVLRDVEGLSNEEVAEALGLTVPTVKARLHRARMFLRGELEDYFGKR